MGSPSWIRQYGLPNISKAPSMLRPVSSSSRVLKIGLCSDKLSLIELSVLDRWDVYPRPMGVPSVANISILASASVRSKSI